MYSRILICGGRSFDNQEYFNKVIEVMEPKFNKRFCIFEGGATGVDRMARVWAKMNGHPHACMPANWTYHGNSAGAIRNTDMLDFFLPDVVIALPGNKGTGNMVKQATDRNIPVYS